jgi:hypothetical protein
MTEEKKENFRTTVPGILTGIGGIIGSLAALITAYQTLRDPNTTGSNTKNTSQELTVPADSARGVLYNNPDSKSQEINYVATGKWVAIPENIPGNIPNSAKGLLSANGAPDFRVNDNMPCPRFPMGALVVVQGDSCIASGPKGTVHVDPGENIYFKMNDVDGLYGDNSGNIRVELSISR